MVCGNEGNDQTASGSFYGRCAPDRYRSEYLPAKGSGRSNAEWMELITQCRQSGLSDSMWCEQQGIPASTFYNAVTRLRKMACAIPAPSKKAKLSMDFTAKQEVVKIDIVPDREDDPEMLTPVSAMRI